ncbi:DEP domain containing 1 [Willisornis vidua]|uniref:DEP domain containing 1 n=1 Tax=Willisornis vidua TaxID=1566151 RepID=A0ABQ9DLE2_9PASS|nr:DEP domain containing 1 [Willisornis vidua]
MPLRSHRQGLRRHGRCFSAAEAADWLHRALRSGVGTATGPGPRGHDVSREQAVQLLRKFLKHHIIEDIKGRWGDENLEDNGALYSLFITLRSPTEDLPHWVLSAMKCLAYWPRNNDMSQATYSGFERDVFRTVADYFLSLPEPLLTFAYYDLFVNVLELLRPHRERVAVEALGLCCLLLPPPSRRRLQLLLRMLGRVCGNVDMPRLHRTLGTRTLLLQTFSRCVLRPAEEAELDELLSTRLLAFLMDHQQEIFQIPTHLQVAVQHHLQHVRVAQGECPEEEICAILPTYSYCKQITPQEFEEQKVSTSQAAMAELLENIIKDKNLSVKDKKKKLKQFQREYPQIYQRRFPRTGSEAALLDSKPTLRQPLLGLRRPRLRSLRD